VFAKKPGELPSLGGPRVRRVRRSGGNGGFLKGIGNHMYARDSGKRQFSTRSRGEYNEDGELKEDSGRESHGGKREER